MFVSRKNKDVTVWVVFSAVFKRSAKIFSHGHAFSRCKKAAKCFFLELAAPMQQHASLLQRSSSQLELQLSTSTCQRRPRREHRETCAALPVHEFAA